MAISIKILPVADEAIVNKLCLVREDEFQYRRTRNGASGKKKVRSPNRQVNQYDKIFQENLEAALPGLIKNLLGIHVVHTEELPDDIQHTKERKPDVLKKITDRNGETFVLHVEFQVKNEMEMVYRMAEYYIMLLRRYRLPVRQHVIYIGDGKPVMRDHIHSEVMTFKYRLIALSTIDYHLLLRSDNPEEKMLAILADFGMEDAALIVKEIVNQIIAASKGDFAALRHMRQLRVLAQLRYLSPQNLQIMESISVFFKDENDILYRRGEMKGIEQGREEEKENSVRSLLLNTDFTIEKIASLFNVTEAFVTKVKESLK